ncbi:MAG: polysaccharide pyruvyl transferase family protein [Lachnospiraceae bacterium]|nr:polysaccharide pyruvyl transferase family protein [Lachnospiraceae bacterium]
MKALILNCCNTSNFGDQAIGKSMKVLFQNVGFKVDLVDIYHLYSRDKTILKDINIDNDLCNDDKKNTGRKQKIQNTFFQELKWIIRNYKQLILLNRAKYDVLIIGGGELIQSNNLFSWLIKDWCRFLKFNNKQLRIYLFAIGVTKEFTTKDNAIFTKIIKNVDKIYVRDNGSVCNAKKIFNVSANLIPDSVVGAYELSNEVNNLDTSLFGITSFKRIKKYGFESIKSPQEYYDWCINEINCLNVADENVKIIYADTNDKIECLKFMKYIENMNRHFKLAEYSSLEEFDNEVRNCRQVISPRMHACIFGLLYGKKVVPIIISEKMKSFISEYQIDNFNRHEFKNVIYTAAQEIYEERLSK